MTWLYDNLATIVVSIIILTIVILIVFKLRKDKKQGKASCGSGCVGCALNGQCHSKHNKE